MSEVPKGWESKQLKELFSFVLGGDWGKDPEYPDADFETVYCIRGTEFRNWKKEKGLTSVERKVKSSSVKKRQLQEGDILIEISGGGPDQPVGRTILIDEQALKVHENTPLVCTNFIRLARPQDSVSSRYLNYYLQSFYLSGEVTKYQGGSNNLRNLKFKEYEKIEVPIAPLEEQKRIADKLDSVLAKVEAAQARLDKIPAILKRFRQSVLAAATSGELTREWREVNNADDWLQIKAVDIVDKIEAGKNIRCQERPPEGGEYGIVKISAVTWGEYNENESKTLNDNSLFLENRRVKVGDFLISRANTLELLGMPVIVHQTTRNLMLSDKVLRLVMNENNKHWFNTFLKSPAGRKEIESRATGNQQSMRNIGQKALLDIDLPLPGERERREIERVVGELFEMAKAVEKQYLKAKVRIDQLTQSILERAFRGELFLPFSETSPKINRGSRQSLTKVEGAPSNNEATKPLLKNERKSEPEEDKYNSIKKTEHERSKLISESEVLKAIKTRQSPQSVQEILNSFEGNSFDTIDQIFAQLKELLALGVVQQLGEGEDCCFGVKKQ